MVSPFKNKAPWKCDNDSDIMADHDYWQELSGLVGWSLMGFTFRSGATYVDSHGATIRLTGSQKDDLMRALTGPKRPESV
jgi:hypothetical protein